MNVVIHRYIYMKMNAFRAAQHWGTRCGLWLFFDDPPEMEAQERPLSPLARTPLDNRVPIRNTFHKKQTAVTTTSLLTRTNNPSNNSPPSLIHKMYELW